MQELFGKYRNRIPTVSLRFERSLSEKIDWDARALSITGARGVGKSTLMLQHIKRALPLSETLYVSMYDFYFRSHTHTETAETFYLNGGRYLYLDEIHKYTSWEREVKSFYDFHPDLHLVVSGSSILALQRSEADLSRRMLYYHLPELSIREFLAIKDYIELPAVSLENVCTDHATLVDSIKQAIPSPLKSFTDYLTFGAYPFFAERTDTFLIRIHQLINVIVDYDLPEVRTIGVSTQAKLKKLLYVLSTSVPFTPNIAKLATQIETSRVRLLEMLDMLEKAQLILNLHSASKGTSFLNKPQKIYLHNTSLIMALAEGAPNVGNLRETFLFTHLDGAGHHVTYPKTGDFLVDGITTIEVGRKSKTKSQIQFVPDAYLALDAVEYGSPGKIPLWLFGFLY